LQAVRFPVSGITNVTVRTEAESSRNQTRIIFIQEKFPVHKAPVIFLLSCLLALASPNATPQSVELPTFEAATIKPGAARQSGFYGEPGGRIFFGGTLKMLLYYAFNLPDNQFAGNPNDSKWFEINAVPPETSPSRQIKVANAEPTPEQRLMLQGLLRDRLSLKYHFATKEGEVYILTRGSKPLELKPPKDPSSDPRVIVRGTDGEALGYNTTTDYLAERLSYYLGPPVLNETGMAGSYDFYLPPDDPGNQDFDIAVLRAVDRLGLKIKRGRRPVKTLIIDHIQQPSVN